MTEPYNILVVDDHAMVREAFASMLRRELPETTVQVASSCATALEAARLDTYAIALVDIELGDRSGMELIAELRTLPLPPSVIAVSTHQEEMFVIRTLKLGARAYVAKDAPPIELFEAIQCVREGRTYISKELAQKFAMQALGRKPSSSVHDCLSHRELEVLLQLAKGKTPKQVAADLSVSVKTVSVHKHNLSRKTGLRSTLDMHKYCQSHGLT